MDPKELFGSQQNTGFVSFDEIENAFKTPTQRQDYYEPKPEPQGDGSGNLGQLADPDGSASHDYEQLPDENPPVDHEHAMRTGERIARLIDTGIDFTLSNFVARNGESYRADERDLQDIAEAWGEISEEHQWNIGPEWTLAILYIMVYGPLVKQALADRRFAEMEARLDAQQAQIDSIKQNQVPATDGSAEPQQPSPYTHQPAAQN